MTWHLLNLELEGRNSTHAVPHEDLRDHELDHAGQCWCRPNVEEDIGLVLHNSLDGREAYEIGARQPH